MLHTRLRALCGLALVTLVAEGAAAQDGGRLVEVAVPGRDGGGVRVLVGGHDVVAAAPTMLVLAEDAGMAQRAALAALDPAAAGAAGWRLLVVAAPAVRGDGRRDALLRWVHTAVRVAGGRLHLAGPADDVLRLALDRPFAFACLRVTGPASALPPQGGVWRRLRFSTLVVDEGEALLGARAREADLGPAVLEVPRDELPWRSCARAAANADPQRAAVATALDDFHDAAAKADAARYFGRFAADGVFLGTDPRERWTVAELRDFAKPYFAAESAWIFTPLRRHVQLDAAGGYASVHEMLGSIHYGECRGTALLRRDGDTWRIVLYDLTVPVPNALLREVVAGIRTHDRAVELGWSEEATPGMSRVFVLVPGALAESGGGLGAAGRARAAGVARLLARVPLAAIYASDAQATQQTVAPLADAQGLDVTVRSGRAAGDLVRDLLTLHRGQSVVVCRSAETVAAVLRELGVEVEAGGDGGDRGALFVVDTPPVGSPRLLELGLDR